MGPAGNTVLGYREALTSRWEQAVASWCPPEPEGPKAGEGEEANGEAAPLGRRIKGTLCRLVR